MKEEFFITSEILIETHIEIPKILPDIYKIDQILNGINIKGQYLIRTPFGQSAEGKMLNGIKMMSNWTLSQKIIYISTNNFNLHVLSNTNEYVHGITMPLSAYCLPQSLCEQLAVRGALEDISFDNTLRIINEKFLVTLSVDRESFEYYINRHKIEDAISFDNLCVHDDYQDEE